MNGRIYIIASIVALVLIDVLGSYKMRCDKRLHDVAPLLSLFCILACILLALHLA